PGHAGPFIAEQELRVGPPLVFLTDQILDRNANVLQKDVVDLVRAIDGDDRTNGHARRLHVDQEKRYAGLRLGRRIGADQTEDPVGVLGQRRPRLVAVDYVMVPVSYRLGPDRGE